MLHVKEDFEEFLKICDYRGGGPMYGACLHPKNKASSFCEKKTCPRIVHKKKTEEAK